jgi:hypothetical protein
MAANTARSKKPIPGPAAQDKTRPSRETARNCPLELEPRPEPWTNGKRSPRGAIAKGTIKRIHVNQHVIRSNLKTGSEDPVMTIKTSKGNVIAHSVEVMGPSRVVYSPDKPLACGARLWIETTEEVRYR